MGIDVLGGGGYSLAVLIFCLIVYRAHFLQHVWRYEMKGSEP